MAAVLLFSLFPQGYFPQLCITAVSVPGTEVGQVGPEGERFLDNRHIEGTLTEMLEEALVFVRKNIRRKTIIDPETGKRVDRDDYPLTAVREVILNALIHRDYSYYAEGMPIQILLFEDRFEVKSPGGLYGRLRIDQLGKVQLDTSQPGAGCGYGGTERDGEPLLWYPHHAPGAGAGRNAGAGVPG